MTQAKASPQRDPLTWMYPEISANRTGRLKVSDLHDLYWEESGNANGKPALFLHGGPGGGSDPKQRRFFHPEKYRIILLDQRGCGKSTPHAELEHNTTWDLVEDCEKLRKHLGIDRWLVYGGSWGSTLALAYAETHPEAVTEIILRGIFLLRRKELLWLYQFGASEIFPDEWQAYHDYIPENERGDFITAYHKRLTTGPQAERLKAAKIWSIWEAACSKLFIDPLLKAKFEDDHTALAFARIEAHYFVNGGFLEDENQLLKNVSKIRGIPGVIVQGRYDIVCPPVSAYELSKAWPEAELVMVPDAGHSIYEPGIARAVISATDRFATWP